MWHQSPSQAHQPVFSPLRCGGSWRDLRCRCGRTASPSLTTLPSCWAERSSDPTGSFTPPPKSTATTPGRTRGYAWRTCLCPGQRSVGHTVLWTLLSCFWCEKADFFYFLWLIVSFMLFQGDLTDALRLPDELIWMNELFINTCSRVCCLQVRVCCWRHRQVYLRRSGPHAGRDLLLHRALRHHRGPLGVRGPVSCKQVRPRGNGPER